jgi:putative transport protein
VEFHAYDGKLIHLDEFGFFAITTAIALGILVGNIKIPLPGGAEFSLGTTGGPLIVGLLFGHFAHIGPLDISVPVPILKTLRELGLMLFLIGAGVSGGAGFVETLKQEGLMLFVYGALMTLTPMLVGYFIAAKLMKLSLFNNLGSITGGMTSTPALGTLISVAGTDDVASAYAATYPIALVSVVLCSQFIVLLMK